MHQLAILFLFACGDPPAADLGPAPAVPGSAPVTRRLTASQYEHSLRDLFGEDIYVPTAPEPDLRVDGLARLGASAVTISPRGVERYEAAAYTIAKQALAEDRRASWMPCVPVEPSDPACARQSLASLGRRAWRRTLTEAEVDEALALAQAAEAGLTGDPDTVSPYWEGLEYGVAYLLQAPDFLMRPESGKDGRYTGLAMASRLSYFLWDSLPDEDLLAAAESGALDTDDGLAAQVDRMIADPRARRGLRAWTDDVLELEKVLTLQKDPTAFDLLQDGMFAAAREQTLRTVEDVVFDQDVDFGELITSRETWIDRSLAMLYGVAAPVPEGFGKVTLPADGDRVGLLGQVSILAANAHPRSSSATLRGKFVRTTLLCGFIPSPPANVNTQIPEPSPEAPTLRDRIAVHLEEPSCAACHRLMDPIGLGFEKFDGMGVYRETEGGAAIDASGDLDNAPFSGLPGLAEAVRNDEDFAPCMVEQMARAAIGRNPDDGEQAAMDWLVAHFAEEDHRMRDLWRAFALSPMFRTVGEVAP
jgi:hypothetical protein